MVSKSKAILQLAAVFDGPGEAFVRLHRFAVAGVRSAFIPEHEPTVIDVERGRSERGPKVLGRKMEGDHRELVARTIVRTVQPSHTGTGFQW